MHNESGHLLVLMAPLMMKMTLITDESQELHQVNLSPAMKSLTANENIIARPAKV